MVLPRIVSAKWMEGIFRHGDVACATECLITTQKPLDNNHQYHIDIQTLLRKHDEFLDRYLQGDRLTGDLSTPLSWRREKNL
jgi:hypothetical protein